MTRDQGNGIDLVSWVAYAFDGFTLVVIAPPSAILMSRFSTCLP